MLRELAQEPRELVVAHARPLGTWALSSAASQESSTGGSVNSALVLRRVSGGGSVSQWGWGQGGLQVPSQFPPSPFGFSSPSKGVCA